MQEREAYKGNAVHESTTILTFFDNMKPLKTDNGCKMKLYYTFMKIFFHFINQFHAILAVKIANSANMSKKLGIIKRKNFMPISNSLKKKCKNVDLIKVMGRKILHTDS